MDLFDYQGRKAGEDTRPLADRMRPRSLDEFIGQPHVSGDGTLIRKAIENDRIFSMILWGPPGCGKTSLANIIARETRSRFVQISAVLSGVKDIREVIEAARTQLNQYGKRTLLFVDEIHRFNKAQQDAFLHHVENGLITLIGASTENPSFEVIPALLSRCRVITLSSHSEEDIVRVLRLALADDERGLGRMGLDVEDPALFHLAALADGDIRSALNSLETAAFHAVKNTDETGAIKPITLSDLETILQKKALLYDKSGDEHFNLISAFHKSLRGSDPDAAMYWLARMLMAGEDPMYVARRMVRFASEDVGLADAHALTTALSAMESYRFLGAPEGELALVQAAVYLATAPKSNSIYTAYKAVRDEVGKSGALPVPLHIRNAPTRLMKHLGYNEGYKYAHNYKGAFAPQDYLPDALAGREFYQPTDRGYEKTVSHRLAAWRNLKRQFAETGKDPGDRES
jgi:putative ATPase